MSVRIVIPFGKSTASVYPSFLDFLVWIFLLFVFFSFFVSIRLPLPRLFGETVLEEIAGNENVRPLIRAGPRIYQVLRFIEMWSKRMCALSLTNRIFLLVSMITCTLVTFIDSNSKQNRENIFSSKHPLLSFLYI